MEPSPERRLLEELEQQVRRQDPAFVKRMKATATDPRPFPTLPALGVGLYILTPIVMLLTGWPGVLILLIAAAAVVASRAVRRLRRRGRPPVVDEAREPTVCRPRRRVAGGMTGNRPDAVFIGGPRDGDVFAASGASLVEVPADQTWHRYVPTDATRQRAGWTLRVYDYDGETRSGGPVGSEIRLHGTRDE
jgi:hypothetical protein